MRHATGGGGTRENPRRGRFDYVITTCVRARGEARRGWSRKPKNGTPRSKYLGALLALTVALTGPAPPVWFCASERGREAPRRDARGGCPTPVRPRWRPRLGSSRCARVLRLPRRDERARSPGSPSTQNPASSVVAVGGSDAGIPDRVAPFPGSRLTVPPRSPPPPTTAAQAILRGWRPLHGRLPRARGGAPRRSTRGGGGRWRERHRR